ncbi:hypothetical protein VNO77_08185 [Canavalia gladiata]|uniref:Uncharacterized protein n=1 Tax=Canavalia gladiata TaxID=3824 RepID=A0AAN9M8D5_CANGL
MLLTGGPGSQFWHSAKHINVPNLSTLDLVLHKGKLRGWTTTESQPWCHLPDFTKTCKNSYKCMPCTRIRNHPGLVHLRGVIAVSGSITQHTHPSNLINGGITNTAQNRPKLNEGGLVTALQVPLETQLRLISSLPDAELFPHSKRSSFLEKDDDVIPDFLRDQCRLQASE